MSWFVNFVSNLLGESASKVSETGHKFRDDSGVRENKDSALDVKYGLPIIGIWRLLFKRQVGQ